MNENTMNENMMTNMMKRNEELQMNILWKKYDNENNKKK